MKPAAAACARARPRACTHQLIRSTATRRPDEGRPRDRFRMAFGSTKSHLGLTRRRTTCPPPLGGAGPRPPEGPFGAPPGGDCCSAAGTRTVSAATDGWQQRTAITLTPSPRVTRSSSDRVDRSILRRPRSVLRQLARTARASGSIDHTPYGTSRASTRSHYTFHSRRHRRRRRWREERGRRDARPHNRARAERATTRNRPSKRRQPDRRRIRSDGRRRGTARGRGVPAAQEAGAI